MRKPEKKANTKHLISSEIFLWTLGIETGLIGNTVFQMLIRAGFSRILWSKNLGMFFIQILQTLSMHSQGMTWHYNPGPVVGISPPCNEQKGKWCSRKLCSLEHSLVVESIRIYCWTYARVPHIIPNNDRLYYGKVGLKNPVINQNREALSDSLFLSNQHFSRKNIRTRLGMGGNIQHIKQ